MELLVRGFPVLKGQEAQVRAFAAEMQSSRADEAAAFYRRMGITHESWHVQEQPDGLWVIAVTRFSTRPMATAAEDYATSTQSFDRWFKEQVKRVTGVDPGTTPLGPPTECIFHMHAEPEHAGHTGDGAQAL